MKTRKLARIGSVMTLVILLTMLGAHIATLPDSHVLAQEEEREEPLDVADLTATAQAEGSVRVIVGLNTAFTPEGKLSGPQAVQDQRSDIQRAQDAVESSLPAGSNAQTLRKFQYVPYIAMSVDAAALDMLAKNPLVTGIAEDIAVQPLMGESIPLIGADNVHTAGYKGNGQAVAVLDSGVDKNHQFLSGSVISEACYSSAGGAIGTSFCPGGNPSSTATDSGLHCDTTIAGCDHGTHVAGTVAGREQTNGLIGVAPEADIIAIQVFTRLDGEVICGPGIPSCISAYSTDLIAALERVLTLHNSGTTIAAANMSLGGDQFYSHCDNENTVTESTFDAIENLRSAGIATVIASGNDGYTDSIGYPACLSNAVSVGSVNDGSGGTTADTVVTSSNSADFLDLLAPGRWITSSVPGGSYAGWSGTSMATPHVAGAWAVLREVNNTATVDSVLTALQDTGVSITDTRSGAGSRVTSRIQLDDALNALATPSAPAAPGNLQAYSVSETEIIVTWDDNSFNEDNFRLERSTGGGSWSVVDSNIAAETTSYTDSGLTCGTEYEYRVRAENSVGDSSWSNTDSATPSQIETNTYTYGGADVPIPDNGTITVDLNVPDTGTLSDIDVHFDAAHSWVEDLDVYLESPAGTRVLLVADEGGNGDNFSGTIFDDEATQTIVGASAPFTGRFQPEGSLADFGGESINGTWKLEVTDDEAGIVGTITNFELDIATLSGTCPSVNSAPVLTPGDVQDLDAIDEDEENATNSGTLVSDVLGTAVTDADGDPEGIAVTDVDNTDGTWQYATTGSNWTGFGSPSQSSARLLAADSNTRVRFVPDTNYHGTVSNGITFRAWDQSDSSSEGSTADASSGGGDSAFSSATASAGISVTSVNDEPEIGGSNPRSVTMDEDGDPTAFSLTLNATDIDGDTLTWSISDPADHGEAVASGMGTSKSISYTPDSNYNGSDSFDVRVTDGKGGQDTVTVNVTITQQNDAPEIDEGESVTVNMDENGDPTAFDLTLNASDIDGDTITWSISDPADHGSANVSGTGTQKSISYTPDTDYSGSDSFVVQVTDGSEQDTITVNVNINPAANNPPEITEGDSVTVNMDEDGDPTSFSLTLNATDIDGDPLDWRIDTVADHGTAIVSGTGSTKAVSYTVDADYNGSDSFVVQVEDGNGGADSITVDVDIDPVNDAPEFTKGSNISVPMNAGAQTRPGWATNIRPGPITATDEATQALSFTLEILNTTGSLSFDTDPALDAATGDLTFHATDATTGTATVRLWLSDDGDDIAPHVNTSTIKQFTIAVGMEGPTGSIDDVSVEMNAEDTVIDLFAAFDDTNDSDADLTYTVQDNTNPSLVGTSIDDTAGTLTLEYTADATGSATITVRVTDTDGNIIDAPFQVVVGSGYNLYIPLIVS